MTEPRPLALLNRSLVVTTVLAAMIVAAAFLLGARNKSDDQWVVHSLAVRDQLTRVLSLVQSTETGQRGYLLTGEDLYLNPYRMALEQLPPALESTQTLVSDNPEHMQALNQLRQLIKAKLDEPVSMHFPTPTPLEDIKKYIEQSTQDEKGGLPVGIPIYVDPEGLKEVEATMASTITINLEGIPPRTTLRLLLRQLGLDYRIDGGLVLISDQQTIVTQEMRAMRPAPRNPQ